MAESEIYRVEIPIIVDDQTEGPFRKAEERVNRFQRNAEKKSREARSHLSALAKMKIEPIMRVRDQLTNSVLKADRIIKKLDATKASPVIEAQDRVSAVVTRINAALKAVERGDIKVAAEMQGPLMDEIVKAKAALRELDGAKSGPVAELRGELFGQLTKAMTEAKKLDSLHVQPRVTMRERVTWKAREIQSNLRRLTSKAWIVTIEAKDKVTGVLKGIASKLASPLAMLGIGGGAIGITTAGLKMVAEEQDLVSSFEVLLGSRRAAEKRMKDLITFAGHTPFTRQEIWRSSRQLELLTRGALSTGKGLTMVGDIAAGTVQPFEEVALWVGRLYDGLESGRPIGEAARRLQEMGALSGEARARIEALADSGKDISEIWPLVAKEFSRFDGLMEKQSKNLKNILLSTKTFFTENVVKRWGQGIASALQPALSKFRDWRKANKDAVDSMGETIEGFGKAIGTKIVSSTEKAVKRMAKIISTPEFEQATFSGRVIMLLSAAIEDSVAWLAGPGAELIATAFASIAEVALKAWLKAMGTFAKTTAKSLGEGNLLGAIASGLLFWKLGGKAIVKGAVKAGKMVAKRVPKRAAKGAMEEVAATTVARGAAPSLGKFKPLLKKVAIPLAVGFEVIDIATADDKSRTPRGCVD